MEAVIIALISLVLSIVSVTVQRRFAPPARMKELQARLNAFQKEYAEATKTKDEEKLKKLEARSSEMTQLTGQMMKGQMVPMMITLPLFLGVLAVVLPLFKGMTVTLPFVVPKPDLAHWALNWSNVLGPLGWYIYVSLVFSMIIQIAIKLYDKRKVKNNASAKK